MLCGFKMAPTYKFGLHSTTSATTTTNNNANNTNSHFVDYRVMQTSWRWYDSEFYRGLLTLPIALVSPLLFPCFTGAKGLWLGPPNVFVALVRRWVHLSGKVPIFLFVRPVNPVSLLNFSFQGTEQFQKFINQLYWPDVWNGKNRHTTAPMAACVIPPSSGCITFKHLADVQLGANIASVFCESSSM